MYLCLCWKTQDKRSVILIRNAVYYTMHRYSVILPDGVNLTTRDPPTEWLHIRSIRAGA